MYSKILFVFFLLFSFNCATGKKDNKSQIVIELQKVIDTNIAFDEAFSSIPFSSLNEKFPEYYKDQLKGIIFSTNNAIDDSIIIATLNTDYKRFKYDLFKKGYIGKEDFKDLKIDSLTEKRKPEQRQLIVGLKFTENKQLLIVDDNNNKNLLDDELVEFDKNFRLQANNNSLPLYAFNYTHQFDNGQETSFKRSIIVYPNPNSLQFEDTEDNFKKRSRLICRFKDYWKGKLTHKNKKYDVAIQGSYKPYLTILIKPDSLKFSNNNAAYNDNFAYRIKDTLNIGNDLFKIDSISNTNSKIVLKKIDNYSVPFYGSKLGYPIVDFESNSVNGVKSKISEITTKTKNYTLLDFWGTWCVPCKKMTPDLKKIYQRHSNDVNFIGIALDDDINEVKHYAEKNEMNWFQAYVNRKKRKSTIISNLNITNFPTFILLDKNRKILYRGVGKNALNNIENILESNNTSRKAGQNLDGL